jgi:hypothetical protein
MKFDKKANADLIPLIKACNVDPEKVKFYDNKSNWKEGELKADAYVKTVQSLAPKDAKAAGGFDPIKRWEVNFKVNGGKVEPMVFHNMKICRFIFTVPAADANDKAVSKALKNLGWLPEPGKFSYQYLVKVPKGSVYACEGGAFKAGDTKEVAFPIKLEWSWIVDCQKIDSKGSGTPEKLA